jgi:glutaredoxin
MSKSILYVKTGCPWCTDAERFLQQHGVDYVRKDVLRDGAAMSRMIEISGQQSTPTFEHGDFMVEDFSVDEFIDAVEQRPDMKTILGLASEDREG